MADLADALDAHAIHQHGDDQPQSNRHRRAKHQPEEVVAQHLQHDGVGEDDLVILEADKLGGIGVLES